MQNTIKLKACYRKPLKIEMSYTNIMIGMDKSVGQNWVENLVQLHDLAVLLFCVNFDFGD